MMSKYLETLLQSIPESDPNYHIKRAEIKRWYEIYGEDKILYGEEDDFDSIMKFVFSSFQEEKFWNDDGKLNSSLFVRFLLSKRDEIPFNNFRLYQVACLVCSEGDIRRRFSDLDNSYLEDFVCNILPRYCPSKPLMHFWSCYINVVGVDNPNPAILQEFKTLLSLYDKSLSIGNLHDIWKCGFECAKQEGCEEALDFFWGKLEVEYDQEERTKQLINVGVYTYLRDYYDSKMNTYYHRDRNINVIKFCLKYLKPEAYKSFMEEDRRVRGYFNVIHSLIKNSFYSYAKKMIEALGCENISHEEYEDFIYYSTSTSMGKTVSQGLLPSHTDFVSWLWRIEGFEEHRQFFLNQVTRLFPRLSNLASFNCSPKLLSMIFESATEGQIKDAIRYGGDRFCRSLYIKNERGILQDKILSLFPDGDKFLNEIDKIVLSEMENSIKGIDVRRAFELFIQGKREEFRQYVQPFIQGNFEGFVYDLDVKISHSFGGMLRGNFKFTGSSVSPCMGDVSVTQSSSVINKG